MSTLGLPLLVVVEGENDVCFLKGMSQVLHRADPAVPDLLQLESKQKIVFLPTGGSNLGTWMSRLASLRKREFYLFDREEEPETTNRREAAELIATRPGCCAAVTSKRTVENYLHPVAIKEACNIELAFDDDANVTELLALKLMEKTGASSWYEMPNKRQRRLHEKAKKLLNIKSVQRMTPELLAQRDHDGEVIGWLRTILRMIDVHSLAT